MSIRHLMVALGITASLLAQEPLPGAQQLTHFRAAFSALRPDSPIIGIAVIGNSEPVILCCGTDTKGKSIDQLTYMPVGSLARLLVADALEVKLHGQLDVASGAEIAGKKLTIRELLLGTTVLPDYSDWSGKERPVDSATLLACAEVAAGADFEFDWDASGMAEMLLLESTVFDESQRDWSTFLRTALAAHASGLDPLCVSDLTDGNRDKISVASMVGEHARPKILRLLLSPKSLSAWWQWRLREAMPLWEGWRMGHTNDVFLREGVKAWVFHDHGNAPIRCEACVYLKGQAGLLLVAGGSADLGALTSAFEVDLFGELENTAVGLGVGMRLGARGNVQPLSRWKGMRWSSPSGETEPCDIAIDDTSHKGLQVEFAGRTGRSVQALPRGKGMRVVIQCGGQPAGVLFLWPQPSMASPQRMSAVFVEENGTSVVPHRLELRLGGATPR